VTSIAEAVASRVSLDATQLSSALVSVGQAWAEEAQTLGGSAAQTIHFEQTGGTSGALVVPKLAWFADKGTKPHVILPRSGVALRFRGGPSGGFVFAKKVNHPGTKGTHFLQRAWQSTRVQRAKADVSGAIITHG
jgi:hypothetical protein